MPRGRRGSAVDQSLFEAALIGFEQMRRNVEEKMAEIRQRLGTRVFRQSTNLNIKAERRHSGSLRPLPSCVAHAAQSSKVCCGVCCPFFSPEFQLHTSITIHFKEGHHATN
jgi:hypothetical protein